MFTCISCRIAFETAEEQRSHFGTDWHRYNMKRRVANLPPVAAQAFNDKVIERREQNAVRPDPRGMFCPSCNKAFSSENSFRSHVVSKKHRDREASLAQGRLHQADQGSSAAPVTEVVGLQGEHASDIDMPSTDNRLETCLVEDIDDDSDTGVDSDIEARIAASRRRISPNDCLFCNYRSTDPATNFEHMSRAHSFFIPDRDLLVDVSGLLAYLGEKVAIGNLCLFCPNGGKEFGSLAAVRKHMIDKGHCKIAYDTNEDRAELADFYDFEGEFLSDQSDWEDVDQDGSEDRSDDEVPRIAGDGLSLVLPSGRVLGHRSLKVYYAQRLRPAPADAHDPVRAKVAAVRQRLADPGAALVPVAGGHGAFGRGLDMVKARNAGEAKWAKKQGKAFKDQKAREHFRTKVGFRNNNQQHFRDPLLQ
ncbi:hypothetical protein CC85DRAFT_166770 [Cutaneotrichosporon oleaginosum]|uniref:C2H2-type domain-containing protein n=1 Tax=Cutaneotrichosporon oleaginosum TaxID=879819 RepID=A0A0J0XG17_9TREE|nr:uncharacterized protein CC85DRAFT_166770 [Cutaneotrichosporon oleaginosum]KLT39997.1 hypothetical protein CC85DRAFT_166770 [Cutaneotrichosporon oleaginosum]